MEQVDQAARGVARDGDRPKPLAGLRGLAAPQQIGRVRRGAGVVLVYPDPRTEMLRVAAGVSDVVLVREQNVAHPAEIFQILNELLDVAGRDDGVTGSWGVIEIGARTQRG